jgi:predicted ATPase
MRRPVNMHRPTKIRLTSFRSIRDLTLELTPIHALIGPNDAGKTSILRAIDFLARDSHWRPTNDQPTTGYIEVGGIRYLPAPHNGAGESGLIAPFAEGVRFAHFAASALRMPAALLPAGRQLRFEPNGAGLPASIDALQAHDLDAWIRIRSRFRDRFPTVREVGTTNVSEAKKVVQVNLNDGTKVHADAMSEGMLYWLAYEVLAATERPSLLLVEEPETGLHPHRIQEVMALLREVSAHTQVLLTTHNPLVVNELQPHEVSVITRTSDHGTRATRLDRTRNFAQRSKVYAPGELWIAYANGSDEQDLVP